MQSGAVEGRHLVLVRVVRETTHHMVYMEGSELACTTRAGIMLDHADQAVAAQSVREIFREIRVLPVRRHHLEHRVGPTVRVRTSYRYPYAWEWADGTTVSDVFLSAGEAAEDARAEHGNDRDIVIVAE